MDDPDHGCRDMDGAFHAIDYTEYIEFAKSAGFRDTSADPKAGDVYLVRWSIRWSVHRSMRRSIHRSIHRSVRRSTHPTIVMSRRLDSNTVSRAPLATHTARVYISVERPQLCTGYSMIKHSQINGRCMIPQLCTGYSVNEHLSRARMNETNEWTRGGRRTLSRGASKVRRHELVSALRGPQRGGRSGEE